MRLRNACSLLLTAALLGAATSHAQTPLGPEFRVTDPAECLYFCDSHGVGVSESGEFLVAWYMSQLFADSTTLAAQWFSPSGEKIGPSRTLRKSAEPAFPVLATGLRGGVSIYWQEKRPPFYEEWDVLLSRELSPDGAWISSERELFSLEILTPILARPLTQGGHVVAFFGGRLDVSEKMRSILLFTDSKGNVIRRPSPFYPAVIEGMAVSPSQEILITWVETKAYDDLLAQLFSAQGRALSQPFRVHDSNGSQKFSSAAPLEENGYIVVWIEVDSIDYSHNIKMRLFAPDGKPRGPARNVAEALGPQQNPQAASDRFGNFIIAWEEPGPKYDSDIWVRLFGADGRPVGPKHILNRTKNAEQRTPVLTPGANGTFVVVWEMHGYEVGDSGIFGQVVAASPADEVCGLSAGRIRCDLARSGGEAELKRRIRPGEWVTGDWDGDGREDLCRFSDGSWLCDLDHFGSPYEASFPFGQAGDLPLLGDVDGDGRTDACVRRGDQLLCDTARDGGTAEEAFSVGEAADALFLADVDGDGRSEACVVRGARFLCDTGHGGGTFEWERSFGSGTDAALFGDSNGDGRDEPCLYRGGELLCDAAQDGGDAEMRLSFPLEAGERLVMVNLDGL